MNGSISPGSDLPADSLLPAVHAPCDAGRHHRRPIEPEPVGVVVGRILRYVVSQLLAQCRDLADGVCAVRMHLRACRRLGGEGNTKPARRCAGLVEV